MCGANAFASGVVVIKNACGACAAEQLGDAWLGNLPVVAVLSA
jgi:hypothetical protein